jgi:hypothetical protein
MIITSPNAFRDDRIRLIAIEMKGAFGNEGALPLFVYAVRKLLSKKLIELIMRPNPEPDYCFTMSFANGPILFGDPYRPKIIVTG